MATTITVPFEEHEDSPIERGDRESGFQFSRIFLVSYADRFVFLRDMFIGGNSGRPKAYHDEFPDLLCFSFDIERIENKPTGPSSITDPEQQIILHDTLAKITIEYKPIEFSGSGPQLRDGTFATYHQGQSVEFVEIKPEGLKSQDSGKILDPDEKVVVPVMNTRHEVTWHQVVNPPWATMSALKGYANESEFFIPASGISLPPETLMFAESSSRQTVRYDGQMATELTLVFLEKRQPFLGGSATYGWNHKFNPHTGGYERIVSAEGGNVLFPTGNLAAIFA